MKAWIEKLFKRMGYVKIERLHYNNFGYGMAKRLDEHRELIELLHDKKFLDSHFWVIGWLETQDDYLSQIYNVLYGHYPLNPEGMTRKDRFENKFVRRKPEALINRQLEMRRRAEIRQCGEVEND